MQPVGDGSFLPIGNIGALQPDVFFQRTFDNPITGDLKYLQLDFVWSLMRAQRKDSGPIAGEVTFDAHIKPLFRQKDVDSMKSVFDLRKYADVSEHADAIFSRLEDGSMPCDVPWSAANVELFRKWIAGGKKAMTYRLVLLACIAVYGFANAAFAQDRLRVGVLEYRTPKRDRESRVS